MFPEEGSYIQFGIWDGGMGAPGTRDWAGGYVPWETPEGEAGYELFIQNVRVECY
jgi:hypothetical protein